MTTPTAILSTQSGPPMYVGSPTEMWGIMVERQHEGTTFTLFADEASAHYAFAQVVATLLMAGHGGMPEEKARAIAAIESRDWVQGAGTTWDHPRLSIIVTARKHDVWVATPTSLKTLALARAHALLKIIPKPVEPDSTKE